MHLANWHLICMKKGVWGTEGPDIKDLNLCLLGSWVKRYIKDENKLSRSIVGRKYCRNRNILHSDKSHAPPPLWKGVILAAQALKFGYKWVVGNGKKIRF
jgi:hypothetical protein